MAHTQVYIKEETADKIEALVTKTPGATFQEMARQLIKIGIDHFGRIKGPHEGYQPSPFLGAEPNNPPSGGSAIMKPEK